MPKRGIYELYGEDGGYLGDYFVEGIAELIGCAKTTVNKAACFGWPLPNGSKVIKVDEVITKRGDKELLNQYDIARKQLLKNLEGEMKLLKNYRREEERIMGKSYNDPTADKAIGHITRELKEEEKKRYIELKHGVKRGQIIKIKALEYLESGYGKEERVRTYKIADVYPHCVLLEGRNGVRTCPTWSRFKLMVKGMEE